MDKKEAAYKFAIENEIKSKNLYALLAKTCKDSEAKKTFHLLESIEKIHEEKLIKAFKQEFKTTELDIEPNLLPAFTLKKKITDPKSIIEYAIDAEISMADIYHEMAVNEEDSELIQLFRSLEKEEKEHKDLLETEMNRIQGTMVWFDDSELNGLMED